LNKAASGYTLQVTGGGLTAATTGSISITAGAATQLVVTTPPPATITAGSAFGLTITAEDALGNVATTFSVSVTLALSSNPGGGRRGGTLTVPAASGVAVSSGLTLTRSGTGYALRATSGSLSAATTAAISVTAGAATQQVMTMQPPGSVTAG